MSHCLRGGTEVGNENPDAPRRCIWAQLRAFAPLVPTRLVARDPPCEAWRSLVTPTDQARSREGRGAPRAIRGSRVLPHSLVRLSVGGSSRSSAVRLGLGDGTLEVGLENTGQTGFSPVFLHPIPEGSC